MIVFEHTDKLCLADIGRSFSATSSATLKIDDFFNTTDDQRLIKKQGNANIALGWQDTQTENIWCVTEEGYKPYPEKQVNLTDGEVNGHPIIPFLEARDSVIHSPTFLMDDNRILKQPGSANAHRYNGSDDQMQPGLDSTQLQIIQNKMGFLHHGNPQADFHRSVNAGILRFNGIDDKDYVDESKVKVKDEEKYDYSRFLSTLKDNGKITDEQEKQLLAPGNTLQSTAASSETWILKNLGFSTAISSESQPNPEEVESKENEIYPRMDIGKKQVEIQYVMELSKVFSEQTLNNIELNASGQLTFSELFSKNFKLPLLGTITCSRKFDEHGNVSATTFKVENKGGSSAFIDLCKYADDPVKNYKAIIKLFDNKDNAQKYLSTLADSHPGLQKLIDPPSLMTRMVNGLKMRFSQMGQTIRAFFKSDPAKGTKPPSVQTTSHPPTPASAKSLESESSAKGSSQGKASPGDPDKRDDKIKSETHHM